MTFNDLLCSMFTMYWHILINCLITRGLLERTEITPSEVNHMIIGTVIQEARTSNLAREVCKLVIVLLLTCCCHHCCCHLYTQ